jgi:hypothetical protein
MTAAAQPDFPLHLHAPATPTRLIELRRGELAGEVRQLERTTEANQTLLSFVLVPLERDGTRSMRPAEAVVMRGMHVDGLLRNGDRVIVKRAKKRTWGLEAELVEQIDRPGVVHARSLNGWTKGVILFIVLVFWVPLLSAIGYALFSHH